MTDAEINAKFLALAVGQQKLEQQIAELRDQAKRHNEAARKRDAAILAAIEGKS